MDTISADAGSGIHDAHSGTKPLPGVCKRRTTALSNPRVYRQPEIIPSQKQPLQLSLFTMPTLCCSCHRLKAGNGRWSRRKVDQELFPKTAFSHGICPTCFKQLYPGAYRRRNKSGTTVAYKPYQVKGRGAPSSSLESL
jgi:hypothetical protein